MDTTGCPEPGCELPAEVLDRAILESTEGPIEHARITCLGGHRFLMPIEMLRQDRCGSGTSTITFATHAGEHHNTAPAAQAWPWHHTGSRNTHGDSSATPDPAELSRVSSRSR